MNKSTKIGLALLVSNALAALTVPMQKNSMHFSEERAAVINHYSSIPIVNDIGFAIGHRITYGNESYRTVAVDQGMSEDMYRRFFDNSVGYDGAD